MNSNYQFEFAINKLYADSSMIKKYIKVVEFHNKMKIQTNKFNPKFSAIGFENISNSVVDEDVVSNSDEKNRIEPQVYSDE